MEIAEFKKIILGFYREGGRTLPWRSTTPWGVVVSEFMLQQTQVSRVIPYWQRWMTLWPSPQKLARAEREKVLGEWSGLGYNRRAVKLHECAAAITARHGGQVPQTPSALLELPGIGPYTAGAVACFAWNHPSVFIETNIRSVILHFFFQGKEAVSDNELLPILEKSLDRDNPRVWYWALMDYGAELKKLTPNPGRKSAHYARQSRFSGSFRQIRGAIVRNLVREGKRDKETLREKLGEELNEMDKKDFYRALEALEKEMIVAEEGGIYRIR